MSVGILRVFLPIQLVLCSLVYARKIYLCPKMLSIILGSFNRAKQKSAKATEKPTANLDKADRYSEIQNQLFSFFDIRYLLQYAFLLTSICARPLLPSFYCIVQWS